MNIEKRARSIRVRQLFLVTAGVLGAVAVPLSILADASNALLAVVPLASMVLVPVAYFLFAASVENAVEALAGEPQQRIRWLAIVTAVPLLGSIFEVTLLRGLARVTAHVEGAANRAPLVMTLAITRLVAGFVLGPILASFFLTLSGGGRELFAIAYAVGPVVSFALLGLITQLIATPVFEQVVQTVDVPLGAAGATSSMAVSSTTTPADR